MFAPLAAGPKRDQTEITAACTGTADVGRTAGVEEIAVSRSIPLLSCPALSRSLVLSLSLCPSRPLSPSPLLPPSPSRLRPPLSPAPVKPDVRDIKGLKHTHTHMCTRAQTYTQHRHPPSPHHTPPQHIQHTHTPHTHDIHITCTHAQTHTTTASHHRTTQNTHASRTHTHTHKYATPTPYDKETTDIIQKNKTKNKQKCTAGKQGKRHSRTQHTHSPTTHQ